MIAKDMPKEKHLLRSQMRALQKKETHGDFQGHQRILESMPPWRQARRILIYSALPGEPDPSSLLTLGNGKDFYFPRIAGEQLGIYHYTPKSRWVEGPFGLMEPDPSTWDQASIAQIDLALIPGLAFDKAGVRLGRGGGFYDRLLSNPAFQGIKIGLCWKAELLTEIPREDHDIVMDSVITA